MRFTFVIVFLLALTLSSCSKNYDGTYSHADKLGVLYMSLSGDELKVWEEDMDGKKYSEMKAKFHVNESDNIILEEIIHGRDRFGNESVDKKSNYQLRRLKTAYIKRWNAVGIKIQNNVIYFYEDLDRSDDLMKFTKE